jgi:hypothetical protein
VPRDRDLAARTARLVEMWCTFLPPSLDAGERDVPQLVEPAFDMIWNGFGFGQSDKYDDEGRWIGTSTGRWGMASMSPDLDIWRAAPLMVKQAGSAGFLPHFPL